MSNKSPNSVSLVEGVAVAALLLAAFMSFFLRTYLQGEFIYTSMVTDYGTHYCLYPWRLDLVNEIRAGYMPLWSSIHGLGTSAIGNIIPASFYPPQILALFMDDFVMGMEISIIIKFLLAGLGTYVLARKLGVSPLPAFLAATGYMFCGHFMKYVHNFAINGAMFTPLQLAGVLYFRDRSFRAGFSMVAFSSFCIALSGSVFDIFYSNLITLLFALFIFVGTVKKQRSLLLNTVLGQFSGALCGFFVLLPFMETLALSWNYHPAGEGTFYHDIRGSFALILPWLIGKHKETTFSPIMPNYHGLVIVLLVSFYFLKPIKAGAGKIFFALLTLIITGMVLGIPPFKYLNFLPIINRIRNAMSLGAYGALAVALTAAFSLEYFRSKKVDPEPLWRAFTLTFGAIVISMMYGRYLIGNGETISLNNLADMKQSFRTASIILFIISATLFLFSRKKLGTLVFMAILVVLSIFGLYRDKLGVNPDPQHIGKELSKWPSVKKLTSQPGYSRAYVSHFIMPPNFWEFFGIAGVETSQSLENERYVNYVRIINELPKPENQSARKQLMDAFLKTHYMVGILPDKIFSPLMNLLGGKYLLLATSEFETAKDAIFKSNYHSLINSDDNAILIENTRALPRVLFSSRWANVSDGEEALKIITSGVHDYVDIPIIENASHPTSVTPDGRIDTPLINSYHGSRVEISPRSSSPGYLVLADNYWPGWKAFVDGTETRIERADYLYRGVWVDGGASEVIFSYEPKSFKIGLWCSITAIIFTIMFIFRKKALHTPESETNRTSL